MVYQRFPDDWIAILRSGRRKPNKHINKRNLLCFRISHFEGNLKIGSTIEDSILTALLPNWFIYLLDIVHDSPNHKQCLIVSCRGVFPQIMG